MASVTLSNIVKRYPGNDEPTVRGIDLTVNDREFVVLVGPSGCGKSTVLRMIAGLEDITSGDIAIGNRQVNDLPPKDRNIAMVFQNYALFPNLTVAQNIAFGLKVRGATKEEQSEAVRAASDILALSELLDRRPGELSGGQRQRVAVGRAIVRKPDVFLFDEPLSNLDANLRASMRTEITKLHRDFNATTVYVTHDQVEAMTMADRIVVFNLGVIQQIGTPREIYEHPANRFVAGFLGNPPMNFVEGRVDTEGGETVFVGGGQGAFRLCMNKAVPRLPAGAERGVTLGVRPEDLYLAASVPTGVNASKALNLEADITEYFGADSRVTARAGDQSVVFVAGCDAPKPGESIQVVADIDRLHFFADEESPGR